MKLPINCAAPKKVAQQSDGVEAQQKTRDGKSSVCSPPRRLLRLLFSESISAHRWSSRIRASITAIARCRLLEHVKQIKRLMANEKKKKKKNTYQQSISIIQCVTILRLLARREFLSSRLRIISTEPPLPLKYYSIERCNRQTHLFQSLMKIWTHWGRPAPVSGSSARKM